MSIAITGAAFRLPNKTNSLEGLWQVFTEEKELPKFCHSPLWRTGFNACHTDESAISFFGQLSDVQKFDRRPFKLSLAEAQNLDPQHRILLELAWEALEDARYPAFSTHSKKIGVFSAICSNDYGKIDTPISQYHVIGNAHSTASGRIAHTFNLSGPAISFDAACSSSSVALHSAVQSLKNNECHAAIVAGTNLILDADTTKSFLRAGMISKKSRCRPFQIDADGYIRSEGSIALILKPLKKAVADNDHIYATIEASSINHNSHTALLAAPNSNAQHSCIKNALSAANLTTDDITYLETHGTGTQSGDLAEIETINQTFNQRTDPCPLYLGASKAIIGHTETISGLTSILKALLIFKYRCIPYQSFKNISDVNKQFTSGVKFPSKKINLSNNRTLYAGICNYGFSGTNAHIILKSFQSHSSKEKQKPKKTRSLTISSYSTSHLGYLSQYYARSLSKKDYSQEALISLMEIRSDYFKIQKTLTYNTLPGLIQSLYELSKNQNYCGSLADSTCHLSYLGTEWPYLKSDVWCTPIKTTSSQTSPWSINTKLPNGRHLFEKTFSASELDNLRQHKINNISVFPGAELLSLLATALNYLPNHYDICQLNYPKKLIELSNANITAQIHIIDLPESPKLEIYLQVGSDSEYLKAATANLVPRAETSHAVPSITTKGIEVQESNEFYTLLKSGKYLLPPEFNCIRNIEKHEELLVARYQPFTTNSLSSIFDSPFQSMSFAFSSLMTDLNANNETFIPCRVARIAFGQTKSPPHVALTKATHLVLTNTKLSNNKNNITFNAYILDRTGDLICSLERAELIRRALPGHTYKLDTLKTFYFPTWKLKPLKTNNKLGIRHNIRIVYITENPSHLPNVKNFFVNKKGYVNSSFLEANDDLNLALDKLVSTTCSPLLFIIEANQNNKLPTLVRMIKNLSKLLTNDKPYKSEATIKIISKGAHLLHKAHKAHKAHKESSLSGNAISAVVKTMSLEHSQILFRHIDLTSDINQNQQNKLIFREIDALYGSVTEAREVSICYRDQARFVSTINSLKPSNKIKIQRPSKLICAPGSNPKSFKLSNERIHLTEPSDTEVQIKVSHTGVNYRDALKLVDKYVGKDRRLGCEFSGHITKIGKQVEGFHIGQQVIGLHPESFSTHITVNCQMITSFENLSLRFASTIPVSALSVLIPISQLKLPDQAHIQIHTATGGLGHYALHYFRQRQFVTHASCHGQVKRQYLSSIGISYISDSRSLHSSDSTSSANLEAYLALFTLDPKELENTLRQISPNGLLIDYTQNSHINAIKTQQLRPDIHYISFNLEKFIESNPAQVKQYLDLALQEFSSLEPILPIQSLTSSHAQHVLNEMLRAEHIGKLVLNWEDHNMGFRSTVIITEGAENITELLVAYYAKRRTIALIMSKKKLDLKPRFQQLLAKSPQVYFYNTDISDNHSLVNVLSIITKTLPKIDTIIHCANYLLDGSTACHLPDSQLPTFENQNKATHNLHNASLSLDIKELVLLSDISGLLCSPGQSNSAIGSATLVDLALKREQLGQHGKTIILGPYSDSNTYSDMSKNPLIKEKIVSYRKLDQFIPDFQELCQQPESVILDADIDWKRLADTNAPHTPAPVQIERIPSSPLHFAPLESSSQGELLKSIQDLLDDCLRSILDLPKNTIIDHKLTLSKLGLDSLLGVELLCTLEDTLNIGLPNDISLQNVSPENIVKLIYDKLTEKVQR